MINMIKRTLKIGMPSRIRWTLAGVLLLALILRLWGIWHGYPYSYYPDEAHFVKRSLAFGSGDLNPHWFHKPAFFMYVLFFNYGLYFIFGLLSGLWSQISEFAVSYIVNPGPFYILGRLTTTLFGLATVWIVYLLGEKQFKKGTGLAAALLLALCFGHVTACQDVKADIPASFFAILSMYLLLRNMNRLSLKDLSLASAAAGMGAATKVYPVVMMIPVTLTILLTARETNSGLMNILKSSLRPSVVSTTAFFSLYFICSPFSFLDPLGRKSTFGHFYQLMEKISCLMSGTTINRPDDFINQPMAYSHGIGDYFLKLGFDKGMGPLIFGICMLGLLVLIKSPNKKRCVFLLFPMLFMIISIFQSPGYASPRHQLPVYPFLAITGGYLIRQLIEKFNGFKGIIIAVLLLSLCLPATRIIKHGTHISRTDTRNLAKEWIERELPAGSSILMDENGPRLLPNGKTLGKIIERAREHGGQGQFTTHYNTYLKYQAMASQSRTSYEISRIRFPWWRKSEQEKGVYYLMSEYDRDMGNPLKEVGVHSYDHYLKSGVDYIVVHSDKYKPFLDPNSSSSRQFPSFHRFYSDLFNRGNMIRGFPVRGQLTSGPLIRIFSLNKASDTQLSSVDERVHVMR